MNFSRVGTFAAMVVVCCGSGLAQQTASAAGTGTVVGHVTFGDTQRPGRFATVILFGVPTEVTTAAKPEPGASEEAQMKAMTAALESLSKTNLVQAQTAADGSYAATDVPPGDYYVFGAAKGYVSPLDQVREIFNAGADVKKPLPGVPVVHVTAEHQSSANITLSRGAAISGVISWDDGSPVTGAIVAAWPAKGDTKPPTEFNMLAMAMIATGVPTTDDLGAYRISGLAAGDYIVTATIRVGTQFSLGSMDLTKMMANTPLVVYAPAGFHKADAKTVTLHDGEDMRDETLTLKLSGLHSVSGRVTAVDSHHGVNSAIVRVTDVQDKEFSRSSAVDAAGNFTVTFVPTGSYTLEISSAEDTEPKPKAKKDEEKPNLLGPGTKTIRSYNDVKQPLAVLDSDVTGLAIEVTPSKETTH